MLLKSTHHAYSTDKSMAIGADSAYYYSTDKSMAIGADSAYYYSTHRSMVIGADSAYYYSQARLQSAKCVIIAYVCLVL
jgi:hypothetical protein